MAKSSLPFWLIALMIFFGLGCTTSQQAGIQPASVQTRDVFLCKGLTGDNRWVGVTDQFLPEDDPQVVVVAKFNPTDINKRIFFELTNPDDMVVLNEEIKNPPYNPLGVLFPMDRLLEVGEEGEWLATVYVDEFPIGDAEFYIGEKPEEEEETTEEYFIVGEETLEEDTAPPPISEEERFSSYIQEATPELDVPQTGDLDIETGPYEVVE